MELVKFANTYMGRTPSVYEAITFWSQMSEVHRSSWPPMRDYLIQVIPLFVIPFEISWILFFINNYYKCEYVLNRCNIMASIFLSLMSSVLLFMELHWKTHQLYKLCVSAMLVMLNMQFFRNRFFFGLALAVFCSLSQPFNYAVDLYYCACFGGELFQENTPRAIRHAGGFFFLFMYAGDYMVNYYITQYTINEGLVNCIIILLFVLILYYLVEENSSNSKKFSIFYFTCSRFLIQTILRMLFKGKKLTYSVQFFKAG